MKHSLKTALYASVLAGLVAMPFATQAQSNKKGGQKILEFSRAGSTRMVQDSVNGNSASMNCPMCKTTWITEIKRDAKGGEFMRAGGRVTRRIAQHACKDCGVVVESKGFGKGKAIEARHICVSCGDQPASCCVPSKSKT